MQFRGWGGVLGVRGSGVRFLLGQDLARVWPGGGAFVVRGWGLQRLTWPGPGEDRALQGYLAHKKQRPPRTLQ